MTNNSILAIYPNQYGFGYAIMNSATELADYGVVRIYPMCNRKTMKRIHGYLDNYNPNVVITRASHNRRSHWSKRTTRIINLIVLEAQKQKRQVFQYNREEIQDVFEQFQAKSKYQICKSLSEMFPELKPLCFPKRTGQMSEHFYTGLFDAISLAISHYYLNPKITENETG